MKKETIVLIIACTFSILFLYTGISKLMEFGLFREQIAASPLLAPIAPFVAFVVPVGEIVLSVFVFLPATRLKGLYVSLGLMTLFTLYIIAILLFDAHVPCSCGGVIEELSWKGHILFNLSLIAAAWIAIRLAKRTVHATVLG